MRSIHERPLEIEGRTVPGHWEGDLIKGAYNRSAVGTLVERTSRYVLLAKMDGTDAQVALEGFTRILRHVPRCMRQTLTYDQGKEMAKHQELSKRVQIDVYFADPHSPWQRGSNENINGLTPVSAQRHGPQPGVTAHAQPHLLAFEYPPACRTQFPKSTRGLQPNDRKNPKRSNLTYCCT